MSRLTFPVSFLVLIIVTGCSGTARGPVIAQDSHVDSNYIAEKQIRYSFTLTNTTGNLINKADFWTYAPVPLTSHQKVTKIIANLPYVESRDDLGNNVMHFELENVPPYGAKVVSITVDLLMTDKPKSLPLAQGARFLVPEQYIESNDARVVSLADKLRLDKADAMVKNDFDWVAQNITSDVYSAEDRGALYALEARKGDCTEFSYLLSSIYRAQKIPARPIGGYVFSGNGIVRAMDYHNWTEFYLNGAWQIADAQKGQFMDRQADHVAMRIISTGGGALASQRFSFAGGGLQVTMN